MTSIIPDIIKRRTEIESEISTIKRNYLPMTNDSHLEIESKITGLNKFKNDILEKVLSLKLEIEDIEKTNSSVNKSSLTRIYSDLRQVETNINKTYNNTLNSLRLKIQQIELVKTSNLSVQMDEEQSSYYGNLREQDDLVTQGNSKADNAISMGKDVLSMFNNQNQKIKRIFGNLKEIGSDARYSEWLTGGIIRRITADKRLFYVLAMTSTIIVLIIYWFFKRKS